jgi:transcriptional regulator with XRE-family HTH domain
MADRLGLSLRAYQDIEAGSSPMRKLHELAFERVVTDLFDQRSIPALRMRAGFDMSELASRSGVAFDRILQAETNELYLTEDELDRIRAVLGVPHNLVLLTPEQNRSIRADELRAQIAKRLPKLAREDLEMIAKIVDRLKSGAEQ